MEFRLFRSDGRIKAVQVLANPGQSISDSIFKSILIELTGSSDFQVKSNEKKSGYLVSRATVKNNPSEMLIYRSNSAVRAVVVSLD
jgi:flagellar FliL protein